MAKYNTLRKLIKKIGKMLLILFSALIICLLILLGILRVFSPGKTEPFLDKNGKLLSGSISEKTFVTIGGVRQGMFIVGKNTDNPVLLYVHGGPAFPNYFLFEKYAPGLEEYFTVCYWEQRGGGLSYTPEVTLESMTFEQLTSDAIEVTDYLLNRFGKEKIYLMAHSGGTPIAIKAAAQAPGLYHAYIGMAQITNQAESEKTAYAWMIEQYTAQGNKKALKKIRQYPVTESGSSIIPFYKSAARDEYMHKLGIGTMRNMKSVFTGVFIPVWFCRAYTLREKMNIWKSKFAFIKKTRLTDQLFAMDIPSEVPYLGIPVYFFSGQYDLTVNTRLSGAYLKKLNAPVKGFYTFQNSAHSPVFEEPDRLKNILLNDVINQRNLLADKY